jgi:hypothetical protein
MTKQARDYATYEAYARARADAGLQAIPRALWAATATSRASAFERWLDTFIEEKGIDPDDNLEVEGPSGLNIMPIGVLLDAIKAAPAHEQEEIKAMIVQLDFVNARILPYFKHLAKAVAL